MEIKKLFMSNNFPQHYVLQAQDENFYRFYMTPFRHLTAADLTPMPYYQEKGENAQEAPLYLYKLYGLEKL